MLKNFFPNLVKNSIFGILDQVFSSFLIFGINFYFAYQSQLNEVGIFALIFSSIGVAQIIQQAILEKPILIKKNVFKYKIILKRFLIVVLVLIISILIIFYGDKNTASTESLNDNFLISWFFLGVVQLLFNLGRTYFYTIKKEQIAFYISFSSTTIIFTIFLFIGPLIEDRLFPYILTICLTKTIILILFFKEIKLIDSKFITEDGSYIDYILLIFISLFAFIRIRYPIFYLAEYAFILAGIFEIFRTITELVLMPFRPISQSLLTFLSEVSPLKIKKSFLKLTLTFFLVASSISFIFYFIFDDIANFFNIFINTNENIKIYIITFILLNIIIIPFSSFILSQKKFAYEFLAKCIPTVLMILFLSFFHEKNNIEIILLILSLVTFIELIIILFYSLKTLKNIHLDESI